MAIITFWSYKLLLLPMLLMSQGYVWANAEAENFRFFEEGPQATIDRYTKPPGLDNCYEDTASPPSNKLLEQILSSATREDASCAEVFTGNAGNVEKTSYSYVRMFAYSMAQDLCDGGAPGTMSDLLQQPEFKLGFDSKVNNGATWDALGLSHFSQGTSQEKGPENFIASYALAFSLGRREAGGNFNEGRDISANNTTQLTREVGLMQVSANTLNPYMVPPASSSFLRNLFTKYTRSLATKSHSEKLALCLNDKLGNDNESKGYDTSGDKLHSLFDSGSCRDINEKISVPNFVVSESVANCFADLTQNCPAFQIKYGAAVSRLRRFGNGPLMTKDEVGGRNKKEYLKPACHGLFKQILAMKDQICAQMDGLEAPPVVGELTIPGLEVTQSSYTDPNFQYGGYTATNPSNPRPPLTGGESSIPALEATRSENTPLGTLNVEAFRNRLASLTADGSLMCARGVRLSLNELFGKGPGNGPNAKEYNEEVLAKWETPDAKYKKVSIDSAVPYPFQDFDVRVLQPSSIGNQHGHIEIYFEGNWYSDFNQGVSLFDASKASYSSDSVYRLLPKATSSWIRDFGKKIVAFLFPKAWASSNFTKGNEVSRPTEGQKNLMAQVTDSMGITWVMMNEEIGDSSRARLYKVVNGKKLKTAENAKSLYYILKELKDTKLAVALADDHVARWIKATGKEKVQARLLQSGAFFEIERLAYQRAGLTLPKSYRTL